MPNWSYTDVTVTGPDADIERFKQACFFVEPKEDASGIDFERIIPSPKDVPDWVDGGALNDWGRENWGTKCCRASTYHVIIALFVAIFLFIGLTLVYLSFERITAVTNSAASKFIDKWPSYRPAFFLSQARGALQFCHLCLGPLSGAGNL